MADSGVKTHKAAKHPYLVTEADAIVLNKADLAQFVSFDRALFEADVRLLNPAVPIIDVSARTGQGIDGWLAWLDRSIAERGTEPTAS